MSSVLLSVVVVNSKKSGKADYFNRTFSIFLPFYMIRFY